QNIFIAKIQPANFGTGTPELVYFTYLGGSGTDSLAGLAVDANNDIYVAGTTSSTNFPTTSNAFQQSPQTGTHGFLSVIGVTETTTNPPVLVYNLSYSTYLAGNGADQITGLAIDTSNQYAYVTGNTTSSNVASNSNPFPANPNNAYQLVSNSPGNPQFFATKVNTTGSGVYSLIYSTYFGGGNPSTAIAQGGGIAVDSSGNMYITGTTNMLSVPGPNPGEVPFPLLNAQQACLNQPPNITSCTNSTNTDAYVAKINPQNSGQNSLVYSTYVGAENNDTGVAIAVDSTSDAYITGGTYSLGWVCSCSEFQGTHGGDSSNNSDAFIAKLGGQSGSVYPLTYFTYLGGSGNDVGNAIQVDSSQAAHVAGNTASPDLPLTQNALQPCLGTPGVQPPCPTSTAENAFVALISTSGAAGDYLTYLGGSTQDQGTGIALD